MPAARFLLDCGIRAVTQEAENLLIETTQQPMRYDFLIAATGFKNDFSGRPEFAALAPQIAPVDVSDATPEQIEAMKVTSRGLFGRSGVLHGDRLRGHQNRRQAGGGAQDPHLREG